VKTHLRVPAFLLFLLLLSGCNLSSGGSDWISLGGPASGSSARQFFTPTGIVVDRLGRIYVADRDNNRVERMDDMQGTNWTSLPLVGTGSGNGPGLFFGPTGIALDAIGNIFVADQSNYQVVRMGDMLGANWAFYPPSTGVFSFVTGVALDSSSGIYVTDFGNNRIARMSNMNGLGLTYLGGVQGHGIGEFSNPTTTVIDSSGRIYVSDYGNNRIVRMDSIGGTGWITLGGTAAGSGTDQFNGPAGIGLDSSGRIYVADSGNNRIVRMDDMSGTNWTTFGTAGSGDEQFNSPAAVFTINGRTYVADSGNNRIARFLMP
jgi:streptogramin lyase